jgi:hypothetical protein
MDDKTRSVLAQSSAATMTKTQWLGVVDLIYDAMPYGPVTLLKLLDKHTQGLGSFEPWRTWAEERLHERFGLRRH